MSLTTGRAPLGPDPAGRFDRPMPAGAVYVEPFLRRVRAVLGERTIVDSERVLLVHRPGRPPDYAFPREDVCGSAGLPEPAALGYVRVPWDAASAWFEEDERVFGGHPRNPYHRVDCVRAKRRLRAEAQGVVLVDTTDVIALYETSRAPQLYAPREAVRTELLVRSPTVTYCPYKGSATHWSLELGAVQIADVAWSYDDPLPESRPIAGYLAFYADRVDVVQDVPTWFSVPRAATSGSETDHA